MEQKADKMYPQEFERIINPNGVNIQQFIKACDDQQIYSLTQFIVTVQKILKLYQKPGRTNPFTLLSPTQLTLIIQKLTKLQQKLKYTVYQIKVRRIIQKIGTIGSNKILPKVKQQQQLIKKIANQVKIQDIISNPLNLNGKFSHPKLLYEFLINYVLPQAGRQILSINDHQKRYQGVLKGLQLCNLLFHPTQIQIQISKNTLIQARVFKMNYEYQFQGTQTQFLKKAANIINEALLCPSDAKIQALLLKILKRMYKLWGQTMHGPLYLNLRNISLFFNQQQSSSKMIKEAAIFCYSVINLKSDIKFSDMLSSSQQLKDLKRNQFFSSKGLALPTQLGTSFNTINLQLPIWKFKLHLQKRQRYIYPVIIQKSNTLLYWKFQVLNFDINFCIYKVEKFRKYQAEQYDKNQQCKSIVKLAKYGGGVPNSKMPVKGQTFLKSGLYHIIFDNSHSMVRAKQILIQICQLQSMS